MVGVIAIADGVGGEDTWDQLRCDLYWYRALLYTAIEAIHRMLVVGGLAQPWSGELEMFIATDTGKVFLPEFTEPVIRSRVWDDFPVERWTAASNLADWAGYPLRAS